MNSLTSLISNMDQNRQTSTEFFFVQHSYRSPPLPHKALEALDEQQYTSKYTSRYRLSQGKIILFLSSTLTSCLHWISTRIKFCPLDWWITIHLNVVRAIFQHNYKCQDCWKSIRSTFECMVILKSRGQGSIFVLLLLFSPFYYCFFKFFSSYFSFVFRMFLLEFFLGIFWLGLPKTPKEFVLQSLG